MFDCVIQSIIKMVKTWTHKEIEYLKKNCMNKFYSDIAKDLNKSLSGVHKKAWRIGLRTGNRSKPSFLGKHHSEETRRKMSIARLGENNWIYGKSLTQEHKSNLSKAHLGKKNGMWKGKNVGYSALHMWIKSHKIKPEFCEECGIKKPYDLANISGKYKRDINDFEWLCRSCHMKKDGRINNLKRGRIYSRSEERV